VDADVLPVLTGRAVSPAELARFVESAPRYTSYPPANRFAPAFSAADAASELAAMPRGEPISLYLHIPFCKSLCWYCGCNVVVTRRRERGTDYVRVLGAEMALLGRMLGSGHPAVEMSIGGGSPNFLSPSDLGRVFAAARAELSLASDAEVSVELDPRDTTDDQVSALAHLGVTRISVGVQDFDPAVQRAVHRMQSAAQTAHLLDQLRRRGIHRINLDLVYGLPAQTADSFAATLDQVIALGPHRVALFGYAHLPELRPHQKLVERAGPLPDAGLRAELFALAVDRLSAAGYVALGIDHFALPEDELAQAAAAGRLHRNFQGYVVRRATRLLACGATGISDSGGAYWQNVADLHTWAERIGEGQLPVARGVALTGDDRLRRDVITRLMCDGGVDFADVESRAGRDRQLRFEEHFAPELDRLEGRDFGELVRVDRAARRIDALPLGKFLARNVSRVFDAYHGQRRPDAAAAPRFSPTL
jgi:oxygen-independent coproporphyrinogen III oxidase